MPIHDSLRGVDVVIPSARRTPTLVTVWQSIGIGSLATLSVLLYQGIPYLFDWDELIYASLARSMVTTGDWLALTINGEPFWEKPPCFFWLQALSFDIFGLSEGSARFPSALASGTLIALAVGWGSRYYSRQFGLLWGALMVTGFLPLLFAKTGLIDPLFNLEMLVGLGSLFEFDQARRSSSAGRLPLTIAGILLGLAVLTKGPLGIGLPLVIWFLYKLWHRSPWIRWPDVVWFGLVSGGVASSWFVLEVAVNGFDFIREFISYQWRIVSTDDGHHGPIYFHVLVYSLGCFPFAAWTVTGWWSRCVRQDSLPDSLQHAVDPMHQSQQQLNHLIATGIGVVLFLFSVVVQTKLVHYTSLLYSLGSFFAAHRISDWLAEKQTLNRWEWGWMMGSGMLLSILLLAIPWSGQHPDQVAQWIEDPLTEAILQTPVTWPDWTYGAGLCLLIGLVLAGVGLVARWSRVWILMSLLLSAWLAGQLCWGQVGSRVLIHTQGGAITFFQKFEEPDSIALVGFRSFIPYFYGPTLVPYVADPQEIPDEWERVVTWSLLIPDFSDPSEWDIVDRFGGFSLLQHRRILD